MHRIRIDARLLSVVVLTICLAAVGCGGSEDPRQVRPAADAQEAEIDQGDGDVSARGGDGGDGADGQDGEDGESVTAEGGSSSSQSSSVTQSGSGDQSSSIVQRSGPGGSSSSSSSSSPGVKTFSGSGATTLSFDVDKPSRLAFTNGEGRPFSLRGDDVSIESRSGRGEVSLEPGDYENVEVRGSSWTIVVRPR